MNALIKHIVAKTYKPLLVKYLTKNRTYRYRGITLEIPPEVFHPGFFFSTRILLKYILKMPLQQLELLELGCGSGLIAMMAAQNGASVTASDINPAAIEYLEKNCRRNHVCVEAIGSDLFENIPPKKYDIIAINPPYYKKDPVSVKDHAWYCGSNGEYFDCLFADLRKCMHEKTVSLMVLFDGCDLDMIEKFAIANDFKLSCVQSRKNLLETIFIYQINIDDNSSHN